MRVHCFRSTWEGHGSACVRVRGEGSARRGGGRWVDHVLPNPDKVDGALPT